MCNVLNKNVNFGFYFDYIKCDTGDVVLNKIFIKNIIFKVTLYFSPIKHACFVNL